MQLRTINLGLTVDWANPSRTVEATRRFFDGAGAVLGSRGCSLRTQRLTTQSPTPQEVVSRRFIECAGEIERELTGIWICVPGPRFATDLRWEDVSYVPELMASTERLFCNIRVSSSSGIHLGASQHAARIMREIADRRGAAPLNFRFAALGNVKRSTPFFPASYHEGADGFTIALELAALANEAFTGASHFIERLLQFTSSVSATGRAAADLARQVESRTGMRFLGIDFSLAPYPGRDQSVIGALEALSHAQAGSASFLLSLNAVNRILKTVAGDVPRVGYNGTMLSVLEDTVLAERVSRREVTIKDLLLCSMLCGCGLDMLPIAASVSTPQLAALIQTIAVIAHQWQKPLLARLIPCPVDAAGRTSFDHPFLVNATPMEAADVAFAVPHPYEGFLPSRLQEREPGAVVEQWLAALS